MIEVNDKQSSIVRLLGGDARYLALFLEFIPGKSLFETRDGDHFSRTIEPLRVLTDVGGAINFIHTKGIIHNDIKPANILFTEQRGAVLCDFGFACTGRSPVDAAGSPWYIPPEFLWKRKRGMPGDIWAFGITMLYVLRQTPIPDLTNSWLIHQVHTNADAGTAMKTWLENVQFLRRRLSCQQEGVALVYRMLDPDYDCRPTGSELRIQHDKKRSIPPDLPGGILQPIGFTRDLELGSTTEEDV